MQPRESMLLAQSGQSRASFFPLRAITDMVANAPHTHP